MDAYALSGATYDRFNRAASRVLGTTLGGGQPSPRRLDGREVLKVASSTIGTYGYPAKIQWFDKSTGTYVDDIDRPATVYLIDPAGGAYTAGQYADAVFAGYRGAADESVYEAVKQGAVIPDASHTVAGIVNLVSAQWLGTGQKNIDSLGIGYNSGTAYSILSYRSVYSGLVGFTTSLSCNTNFDSAVSITVGPALNAASQPGAVTLSRVENLLTGSPSTGNSLGLSGSGGAGIHATYFSGGSDILYNDTGNRWTFGYNTTRTITLDLSVANGPKISTGGGTGEFATQVMSGFQTVRAGTAISVGNVAGGWAGGAGITGQISVVDGLGTSRAGQTTTLSGAIFTAGILTDASAYSVSPSVLTSGGYTLGFGSTLR